MEAPYPYFGLILIAILALAVIIGVTTWAVRGHQRRKHQADDQPHNTPSE